MGAFKQFLSTDVTVVPFVVNKSFYFEGSASLEAAGINQFFGVNTEYSSSQDIGNTTTNNPYWTQQPYASSLIWNSVKQLYFTNYIPTPSQSQAPAPVYDYNGNLISDYTSSATNARFYNYEQNSLFQTNSFNYTSNYGYGRFFPTSLNANAFVLSIPRDLYGDYINPKSFVYEANVSQTNIYKWYDDLGEGIISQDVNGNPTVASRGVITYSHGIVALSQYSPALGTPDRNNVTCSFQSSRTIYETQYKCTIRPDEFNYSLNPSLISGSTDGTPYNFVTGSYFSPYVTTVGLYNERQELLAVAKLAQPLPTSRTTDTTIVINLDR